MKRRQLIRMARWAHRPPSETRVKLVFGIILFCLALFLVEYLGLWPEGLSANSSLKIKPVK